MRTEIAGDLIVPDNITVGELFDAIAKTFKKSPGNIDFYDRC